MIVEEKTQKPRTRRNNKKVDETVKPLEISQPIAAEPAPKNNNNFDSDELVKNYNGRQE